MSSETGTEPSAPETRRDPVATMLRARSIAVIGASAKEDSFGYNVVNYLTSTGYHGEIYPVTPRYQSIGDLRCYSSIADAPQPVDCAILAIADQRLEAALEAAISAGARSAVIFGTAVEDGAANRKILTERLAAMGREAGIAMCGPNCMGFLNFIDPVMVGGWPYKYPPPAGHIGFVTHSGSSYSAFALNQRQLGMNYMISSGLELVTTAADYIQFLTAQPETRAIGCILETARAPERFLAALEEADRRGIPIVVLKLGRSEHGRAMSRAHSGALAGTHAAYRAVFEKHNVVAVETLDELADTLEVLACGRVPTTEAIGLATDSGGERSMIVDLATDFGIKFAPLTEETTRILSATLDPGLAPINPVDLWGTGHNHEQIAETCIQALADDPGVGQVIFANNMLSGRPLLRTWCNVIERVHARTAKPVMAMANLTSAIDRSEAARLRSVGMPVLMGTRAGLVAVAALAEWHRRRRDRRAQQLPAIELKVGERWRSRLAGGGPTPDLAEGLRLARDFGCCTVEDRIAETPDQVIAAAETLGFPVVVKTLAAGLDHKSDHGGVALGLRDTQSLSRAYTDMRERLGPRVLVQSEAPPGSELFIGMTLDEQFGPLVTIGLGGIFVEILKDVITFLPPIGVETACDYLRRLKSFRLLDGARGHAKADLIAVGEMISRFSVLAVSLGDCLKEMDVNPVIAGPSGAWAVDALVIPRPPHEAAYSHIDRHA